MLLQHVSNTSDLGTLVGLEGVVASLQEGKKLKAHFYEMTNCSERVDL